MLDIAGAVGAVLADLNVDEATIKRIQSNLQGGDVDPAKFKETAPEAFGTLDGGSEMGVHTGKAHSYMADSMKEMLKTLGYYSEGVETFRKKVQDADDVSAEDLRRYHRAVQNAEGVNGNNNPDYNPYGSGDK